MKKIEHVQIFRDKETLKEHCRITADFQCSNSEAKATVELIEYEEQCKIETFGYFKVREMEDKNEYTS